MWRTSSCPSSESRGQSCILCFADMKCPVFLFFILTLLFSDADKHCGFQAIYWPDL